MATRLFTNAVEAPTTAPREQSARRHAQRLPPCLLVHGKCTPPPVSWRGSAFLVLSTQEVRPSNDGGFGASGCRWQLVAHRQPKRTDTGWRCANGRLKRFVTTPSGRSRPQRVIRNGQTNGCLRLIVMKMKNSFSKRTRPVLTTKVDKPSPSSGKPLRRKPVSPAPKSSTV